MPFCARINSIKLLFDIFHAGPGAGGACPITLVFGSTRRLCRAVLA